MLFAATIILTELPRDARRNFQLLGNGSVGVNDHENHQRKQEHDSAADSDAVEVLLDDARTGLGGVHRAGDHVGDARALAGVQQDEHDEADARNDEQDERDDEERIQGSSLFFRSKVYRYASF